MFSLLGIMSLNRPVQTLGILVIYFGVLATLRGVTSVLGILGIIVGILLISNLIQGALFLGVLFAVWFMIENIGNVFINTRFSQKRGERYWFVFST